LVALADADAEVPIVVAPLDESRLKDPPPLDASSVSSSSSSSSPARVLGARRRRRRRPDPEVADADADRVVRRLPASSSWPVVVGGVGIASTPRTRARTGPDGHPRPMESHVESELDVRRDANQTKPNRVGAVHPRPPIARSIDRSVVFRLCEMKLDRYFYRSIAKLVSIEWNGSRVGLPMGRFGGS
jgi:hypothetical protein